MGQRGAEAPGSKVLVRQWRYGDSVQYSDARAKSWDEEAPARGP